MKHTALYTAIAASLSLASIAHADMNLVQNDKGNLDMYVVLDAAVVSQNHSLSISPTMPNQIYPYQPTAQGVGSVSGLLGGGLSDSRVGFKGAMNMDNGAKAIFNLESGFDVTSGQLNNAAAAVAANPNIKGAKYATNMSSVNADSSLNGQLFGRAAWFGLQDPTYGKITAGLQNNPMKDVFASYDPVKSDTFSPFGESGTVGGGGGVSEDARMENSLEYSNAIAGVSYSLAYQFGNNTSSNGIVGGSGVGDGVAVRVGYETSMFGVQASYNDFKDALKAVAGTSLGQIGLAELNTEAWLLAGKFTGVQDLTIEGGWERFTNSAPTDAVNISSIWGIGVSGVTAAFAPGVSQTTNIYFFGGDYNVMPKLNIALGYYDTMNENKSGTTNTNGSIKTTSAILDYRMYKQADVYAVASTNQFSGPGFNGTNSTQTAFGVGARVKF